MTKRIAISLNFTLLSLLLMGCTSLFKQPAYDVREDIVYKTAESRPLTGTLYIPNGDNLKPAALVVHGGGWKKKSGDMESICEELASAGFVVFSPDYRLAPQDRYPKQVDDIKDALTWLKQNAPTYRADPEKISGWGYSAGAHLILLVGLDPAAGLRAIVAGGTPADLTAWPDSPLVYDLLGVTLNENPQLWQEASPVNHVQSKSPPVFLYHGKLDAIVEHDQMEKMSRALRDKNTEVETYTASYMGHIATYFLSQESVERGISFIKTHIK